MWEWRVFWSLPANCSDLDVWRVLEDTKRKRSDVYLVATDEVGVKLRGEQELEVKIMIEKDVKSGAEKWTKLDGGKHYTVHSCRAMTKRLNFAFKFLPKN